MAVGTSPGCPARERVSGAMNTLFGNIREPSLSGDSRCGYMGSPGETDCAEGCGTRVAPAVMFSAMAGTVARQGALHPRQRRVHLPRETARGQLANGRMRGADDAHVGPTRSQPTRP